MWAWMSLYDASGKSAGMWIPMVFATMPNLVDDACTAFPRKRASRAAILMKNFDPTDFATVYITLSLPCGSKTGRIPTRYGATYFSQWRKCSANGLRLNCILCYVPAKYFRVITIGMTKHPSGDD